MADSQKVRILHNPRCSKSRQTLQILQEQGIEPEIVEYLLTPPDHEALEQILSMLQLEPRQLMRTHEDEYKKLQLDNPELNREQLIQAMVEHPGLIERPIVIRGNKAMIGRPPEKILELIQ